MFGIVEAINLTSSLCRLAPVFENVRFNKVFSVLTLMFNWSEASVRPTPSESFKATRASAFVKPKIAESWSAELGAVRAGSLMKIAAPTEDCGVTDKDTTSTP